MSEQSVLNRPEQPPPPDEEESYWQYTVRKFKQNRLAVLSFYLVVATVVIALLANLLANNKPLYLYYQGDHYFPAFREYGVNAGVLHWPDAVQNVNWYELNANVVVWPPIPYADQSMDLSNTHVSPLGTQDVDSWRWRHWLGTDHLGRDVLAGLIHATRISLSVGVIAMGIAGLIGILLGSLAGYFGDDRWRVSRIRLLFYLLFGSLGLFYGFYVRGYVLADALGQSLGLFLLEFFKSLLLFFLFTGVGYRLAWWLERKEGFSKTVTVPVDILISRLIEVVVTIPVLFLIVFIIAIAEPSLFLVMMVIGLTQWTGIARFMRAELLRIRQLNYIEAVQALGYSHVRILIRHGIPNGLPPVLITIAFGVASAILVESTLSFLGLGVPTDTITWGSMLSLSRQYASDWWLAIFPGSAIFLTVTAFNLIAAALTDILNPKQAS